MIKFVNNAGKLVMIMDEEDQKPRMIDNLEEEEQDAPGPDQRSSDGEDKSAEVLQV
jgi:hypothetical protein